MNTDKEVFKGKTLPDLFKEIYENSINTKKQVKTLISSITDLVTSPADATLVAPLITEYLEVGVKNDEHLLKLATIIQRAEAGSKALEDLFDQAELDRILEEQEELSKEIKGKKE